MKKLTVEDVILKSYNHWIKNKRKPCMDGGSCKYRMQVDDKHVERCAAGIFIPKKLYRDGMEGSTVLTLFNDSPDVANLFTSDAKLVLADLQTAHDDNAGLANFRENMLNTLEHLASGYNVTLPENENG